MRQVFLAAMLVSPLAMGAPPPELPTTHARQAFAMYTAALADPALDWERRVEVLRLRGALLSNHYRLDEALADFRAAADLAPHYSLAHLDVATVLTKLGLYPQAYRSFKQGFRANPSNLVLFMVRGMAYFNDRKYVRAVRDFRRHLQFNPSDAYRMMWLYLALEHQGRSGEAALRGRAAALDRSTWPGPLVDLYLGRKTVEDIVRRVGNARGPGAAERRCEAYFFIAQRFAAQGERAEAKIYFEKTVGTEVRGFMEYATARLELRRMTHQR